MNIFMRLIICLALTAFNLAAHAQSNNKTTSVEVENGPNNPVPVNVVNTVDANVVNTIAADELLGFEFGPIAVKSITLSFGGPVRLHAVSASVYTTDSNACKISVSTASDSVLPEFQPLGLSALSNGQAATASQTYDAPIEGVEFIKIGGSAPTCVLHFSVSFTDIVSSTESTSGTQSLSLARERRIEVQ